jgi:lambda repressor-like predicted transcriptional regulator
MPKKIQNMEPDEIRILLVRAKVTQAAIARELGVHKTSINKVILGWSVSDRIRQCIANKVGVDIKRIWPDPYLYGSARRRGRPFDSGHQPAAM